MNVNEYMDRDYQLLLKRVDDVRKAYELSNPSHTMSQATEMFDAFERRFALEDFLNSKVHETPTMKAAIAKLLIRRQKIRELLEDMLMLHVSEPDFKKSIKVVMTELGEFLKFVKNEFSSEFISKISEGDLKNMSHALEDRIHAIAF